MTVESSTQYVAYETDGVTLAYAIPFYFLDGSHIYAQFIASNSSETVTSITRDTDFTVTGAGNKDGGTLTLAVAKAAGYTLYIERDVPVTQETAYQQNSAFPAKTTETALDKLTMIAQQLTSSFARSIRYPVSEYDTDGTLPVKSERGGTVFGFDSLGAQTLIPIPASVGAGDLRNESWTAGYDFVAGTSTSVTLSREYTTKANLGSLVMDGVGQDPSTYSLSGTTLTFLDDSGDVTPIPAGTKRIWCTGGTTLSLNTPALQSVTDGSLAPGSAVYNRAHFVVDPRDKGAVGNGLVDDTAAWHAAVAAVSAAGGGIVRPSPGTYLVSAPIVSTADNVVIDGGDKYAVTVTVPNNAGGFTGYNPNSIFILNGNNNGLRNIGIDGNIANNAAQAFGAVAQTVAKSGFFVEDCYIRNVIYNGIILNPVTGTSSNFSIRRNRIENIGWGAITGYCSTNGDIESNSVVSCGANGILTGYNSNTNNFNVAQNIRINNNFVTKAVPPTHITSGSAEVGFMIAVGAGDSYITVASNVCIDNRNAEQDGIGLGQDGTRVNEGLIFDGNVVVYAGLFGVDVSSNHIVSNNYIRYSAQNGIKLGTDAGGNLVNATVVDNIVDSCNLAGTTQDGIYCAATLTVGIPTALYENIKINGNRVMDFNATPATVYGLNIGFQNNLVYQNCEFNNNDFSQLAGVNGSAFRVSGTGGNYVGWSYKGNKHPNALPAIAGTTPLIMGIDAATIVNGGATTVSNFLGGYDGQELTVQSGNANTTYQNGGGISIHGAADQAAAATSIYKFYRYTGWFLNQFYTP